MFGIKNDLHYLGAIQIDICPIMPYLALRGAQATPHPLLNEEQSVLYSIYILIRTCVDLARSGTRHKMQYGILGGFGVRYFHYFADFPITSNF